MVRRVITWKYKNAKFAAKSSGCGVFPETNGLRVSLRTAMYTVWN